MQTTFESIKESARRALLQLQDMNAATPPLRKDRESVLEELDKLKNNLMSAWDLISHRSQVPGG